MRDEVIVGVVSGRGRFDGEVHLSGVFTPADGGTGGGQSRLVSVVNTGTQPTMASRGEPSGPVPAPVRLVTGPVVSQPVVVGGVSEDTAAAVAAADATVGWTAGLPLTREPDLVPPGPPTADDGGSNPPSSGPVTPPADPWRDLDDLVVPSGPPRGVSPVPSLVSDRGSDSDSDSGSDSDSVLTLGDAGGRDGSDRDSGLVLAHGDTELDSAGRAEAEGTAWSGTKTDPMDDPVAGVVWDTTPVTGPRPQGSPSTGALPGDVAGDGVLTSSDDSAGAGVVPDRSGEGDPTRTGTGTSRVGAGGPESVSGVGTMSGPGGRTGPGRHPGTVTGSGRSLSRPNADRSGRDLDRSVAGLTTAGNPSAAVVPMVSTVLLAGGRAAGAHGSSGTEVSAGREVGASPGAASLPVENAAGQRLSSGSPAVDGRLRSSVVDPVAGPAVIGSAGVEGSASSQVVPPRLSRVTEAQREWDGVTADCVLRAETIIDELGVPRRARDDGSGDRDIDRLAARFDSRFQRRGGAVLDALEVGAITVVWTDRPGKPAHVGLVQRMGPGLLAWADPQGESGSRVQLVSTTGLGSLSEVVGSGTPHVLIDRAGNLIQFSDTGNMVEPASGTVPDVVGTSAALSDALLDPSATTRPGMRSLPIGSSTRPADGADLTTAARYDVLAAARRELTEHERTVGDLRLRESQLAADAVAVEADSAASVSAELARVREEISRAEEEVSRRRSIVDGWEQTLRGIVDLTDVGNGRSFLTLTNGDGVSAGQAARIGELAARALRDYGRVHEWSEQTGRDMGGALAALLTRDRLTSDLPSMAKRGGSVYTVGVGSSAVRVTLWAQLSRPLDRAAAPGHVSEPVEVQGDSRWQRQTQVRAGHATQNWRDVPIVGRFVAGLGEARGALRTVVPAASVRVRYDQYRRQVVTSTGVRNYDIVRLREPHHLHDFDVRWRVRVAPASGPLNPHAGGTDPDRPRWVERSSPPDGQTFDGEPLTVWFPEHYARPDPRPFAGHDLAVEPLATLDDVHDPGAVERNLRERLLVDGRRVLDGLDADSQRTLTQFVSTKHLQGAFRRLRQGGGVVSDPLFDTDGRFVGMIRLEARITDAHPVTSTEVSRTEIYLEARVGDFGQAGLRNDLELGVGVGLTFVNKALKDTVAFGSYHMGGPSLEGRVSSTLRHAQHAGGSALVGRGLENGSVGGRMARSHIVDVDVEWTATLLVGQDPRPVTWSARAEDGEGLRVRYTPAGFDGMSPGLRPPSGVERGGNLGVAAVTRFQLTPPSDPRAANIHDALLAHLAAEGFVAMDGDASQLQVENLRRLLDVTSAEYLAAHWDDLSADGLTVLFDRTRNLRGMERVAVRWRVRPTGRAAQHAGRSQDIAVLSVTGNDMDLNGSRSSGGGLSGQLQADVTFGIRDWSAVAPMVPVTFGPYRYQRNYLRATMDGTELGRYVVVEAGDEAVHRFDLTWRLTAEVLTAGVPDPTWTYQVDGQPGQIVTVSVVVPESAVVESAPVKPSVDGQVPRPPRASWRPVAAEAVDRPADEVIPHIKGNVTVNGSRELNEMFGELSRQVFGGSRGWFDSALRGQSPAEQASTSAQVRRTFLSSARLGSSLDQILRGVYVTEQLFEDGYAGGVEGRLELRGATGRPTYLAPYQGRHPQVYAEDGTGALYDNWLTETVERVHHVGATGSVGVFPFANKPPRTDGKVPLHLYPGVGHSWTPGASERTASMRAAEDTRVSTQQGTTYRLRIPVTFVGTVVGGLRHLASAPVGAFVEPATARSGEVEISDAIEAAVTFEELVGIWRALRARHPHAPADRLIENLPEDLRERTAAAAQAIDRDQEIRERQLDLPAAEVTRRLHTGETVRYPPRRIVARLGLGDAVVSDIRFSPHQQPHQRPASAEQAPAETPRPRPVPRAQRVDGTAEVVRHGEEQSIELRDLPRGSDQLKARTSAEITVARRAQADDLFRQGIAEVERLIPGATRPGSGAYMPGIHQAVAQASSPVALRSVIPRFFSSGEQRQAVELTAVPLYTTKDFGGVEVDLVLLARPDPRHQSINQLRMLFGHANQSLGLETYASNNRFTAHTQIDSSRWSTAGSLPLFTPGAGENLRFQTPGLTVANDFSASTADTIGRDQGQLTIVRSFGNIVRFDIPLQLSFAVHFRPLTASASGLLPRAIPALSRQLHSVANRWRPSGPATAHTTTWLDAVATLDVMTSDTHRTPVTPTAHWYQSPTRTNDVLPALTHAPQAQKVSWFDGGDLMLSLTLQALPRAAANHRARAQIQELFAGVTTAVTAQLLLAPEGVTDTFIIEDPWMTHDYEATVSIKAVGASPWEPARDDVEPRPDGRPHTPADHTDAVLEDGPTHVDFSQGSAAAQQAVNTTFTFSTTPWLERHIVDERYRTAPGNITVANVHVPTVAAVGGEQALAQSRTVSGGRQMSRLPGRRQHDPKKTDQDVPRPNVLARRRITLELTATQKKRSRLTSTWKVESSQTFTVAATVEARLPLAQHPELATLSPEQATTAQEQTTTAQEQATSAQEQAIEKSATTQVQPPPSPARRDSRPPTMRKRSLALPTIAETVTTNVNATWLDRPIATEPADAGSRPSLPPSPTTPSPDTHTSPPSTPTDQNTPPSRGNSVTPAHQALLKRLQEISAGTHRRPRSPESASGSSSPRAHSTYPPKRRSTLASLPEDPTSETDGTQHTPHPPQTGAWDLHTPSARDRDTEGTGPLDHTAASTGDASTGPANAEHSTAGGDHPASTDAVSVTHTTGNEHTTAAASASPARTAPLVPTVLMYAAGSTSGGAGGAGGGGLRRALDGLGSPVWRSPEHPSVLVLVPGEGGPSGVPELAGRAAAVVAPPGTVVLLAGRDVTADQVAVAAARAAAPVGGPPPRVVAVASAGPGVVGRLREVSRRYRDQIFVVAAGGWSVAADGVVQAEVGGSGWTAYRAGVVVPGGPQRGLVPGAVARLRVAVVEQVLSDLDGLARQLAVSEHQVAGRDLRAEADRVRQGLAQAGAAAARGDVVGLSAVEDAVAALVEGAQTKGLWWFLGGARMAAVQARAGAVLQRLAGSVSGRERDSVVEEVDGLLVELSTAPLGQRAEIGRRLEERVSALGEITAALTGDVDTDADVANLLSAMSSGREATGVGGQAARDLQALRTARYHEWRDAQGFVYGPLPADGDCFFYALIAVFGRRLMNLGVGLTPLRLRRALADALAADFAQSSPRWAGFIPDSTGPDGGQVQRRFLDWIRRPGSWNNEAGDLVVELAAEVFGLRITVLGLDGISSVGPVDAVAGYLRYNGSHYEAVSSPGPLRDGEAVWAEILRAVSREDAAAPTGRGDSGTVAAPLAQSGSGSALGGATGGVERLRLLAAALGPYRGEPDCVVRLGRLADGLYGPVRAVDDTVLGVVRAEDGLVARFGGRWTAVSSVGVVVEAVRAAGRGASGFVTAAAPGVQGHGFLLHHDSDGLLWWVETQAGQDARVRSVDEGSPYPGVGVRALVVDGNGRFVDVEAGTDRVGALLDPPARRAYGMSDHYGGQVWQPGSVPWYWGTSASGSGAYFGEMTDTGHPPAVGADHGSGQTGQDPQADTPPAFDPWGLAAFDLARDGVLEGGDGGGPVADAQLAGPMDMDELTLPAFDPSELAAFDLVINGVFGGGLEGGDGGGPVADAQLAGPMDMDELTLPAFEPWELAAFDLARDGVLEGGDGGGPVGAVPLTTVVPGVGEGVGGQPQGVVGQQDPGGSVAAAGGGRGGGHGPAVDVVQVAPDGWCLLRATVIGASHQIAARLGPWLQEDTLVWLDMVTAARPNGLVVPDRPDVVVGVSGDERYLIDIAEAVAAVVEADPDVAQAALDSARAVAFQRSLQDSRRQRQDFDAVAGPFRVRAAAEGRDLTDGELAEIDRLRTQRGVEASAADRARLPTDQERDAVLNTVRKWRTSWASAVGDGLLLLLADVLGVSFQIHGPAGGAGHRQGGFRDPGPDGPVVHVYYTSSRGHYDAVIDPADYTTQGARHRLAARQDGYVKGIEGLLRAGGVSRFPFLMARADAEFAARSAAIPAPEAADWTDFLQGLDALWQTYATRAPGAGRTPIDGLRGVIDASNRIPKLTELARNLLPDAQQAATAPATTTPLAADRADAAGQHGSGTPSPVHPIWNQDPEVTEFDGGRQIRRGGLTLRILDDGSGAVTSDTDQQVQFDAGSGEARILEGFLRADNMELTKADIMRHGQLKNRNGEHHSPAERAVAALNNRIMSVFGSAYGAARRDGTRDRWVWREASHVLMKEGWILQAATDGGGWIGHSNAPDTVTFLSAAERQVVNGFLNSPTLSLTLDRIKNLSGKKSPAISIIEYLNKKMHLVGEGRPIVRHRGEYVWPVGVEFAGAGPVRANGLTLDTLADGRDVVTDYTGQQVDFGTGSGEASILKALLRAHPEGVITARLLPKIHATSRYYGGGQFSPLEQAIAALNNRMISAFGLTHGAAQWNEGGVVWRGGDVRHVLPRDGWILQTETDGRGWLGQSAAPDTVTFLSAAERPVVDGFLNSPTLSLTPDTIKNLYGGASVPKSAVSHLNAKMRNVGKVGIISLHNEKYVWPVGVAIAGGRSGQGPEVSASGSGTYSGGPVGDAASSQPDRQGVPSPWSFGEGVLRRHGFASGEVVFAPGSPAARVIEYLLGRSGRALELPDPGLDAVTAGRDVLDVFEEIRATVRQRLGAYQALHLAAFLRVDLVVHAGAGPAAPRTVTVVQEDGTSRQVVLAPDEFGVLLALRQAPGVVLSGEQIQKFLLDSAERVVVVGDVELIPEVLQQLVAQLGPVWLEAARSADGQPGWRLNPPPWRTFPGRSVPGWAVSDPYAAAARSAGAAPQHMIEPAPPLTSGDFEMNDESAASPGRPAAPSAQDQVSGPGRSVPAPVHATPAGPVIAREMTLPPRDDDSVSGSDDDSLFGSDDDDYSD
ncbi:hypothetical protein ACIBTV_29605 [Micromonospora sp. NPDC049366]|uniref:hypothetical protein n=1 Tax=Micromonospora sp. NPDC049366 TaxID=3364271 RepID=UPI0037AB7E03